MDHLLAWCGNNHLLLNVTKTKKMVVDFRRARTKLNTISILGEGVEVQFSLQPSVGAAASEPVTLRN